MRIDRAFALSALEAALTKGAEAAEVHLRTRCRVSAEVKGQKVDALESSSDFGFAVRVIKDRRLGFSYATHPHAAGEVVKNAIEAAQWTTPDDALLLPSPSPVNPVEICDPSIQAMREDDALARALTVEQAALDSDKRIKKVRKASVSLSTGEVLVLNSLGVERFCPMTSCSAQIMVVAQENGDSQMGWDFNSSRYAGDINSVQVGRTAALRALQLLGARKIRPVKSPIALDSSVATEFLGIFASLLSSDMVQKGKSLLRGKLQQEVISPLITITDDGTIPRKSGSRPFDDEGVATSGKRLIHDGVLKGFLYSSYTARKEGTSSTGNAFKPGLSALPSVGPSNLYLSVNVSATHGGDIRTMLGNGFYVTEAMGLHTANPISGEFSVGVSGLWVEDGVAKHPVKEAIISGNILSFFRKVTGAGDDMRFYGNMASPSLLIDAVDISA